MICFMSKVGFLAVVVVVVVVASTLSTNRNFQCDAFHLPSGTLGLQNRPSFELSLQKGWLDDESNDEEGRVSREDLQRDMLGMEPKVKRKRRKGGRYKPVDNRDHLPFSVRTKTPDDPYKTRYQKEKEEQLRKKNNGVRRKTTDLDHHMLSSTKREIETTPSRLVQKKNPIGDNDKATTTVLGEFELDRSTTSGDVIVLGDREYRVETARCQYKYAGGQRFVMLRKILEVKELTRSKNEEDLLQQLNSSPTTISNLSDDFQ